MELQTLGQAHVIRSAADVAVARERVRRRRLTRLRNILLPIAAWALFRLATGNPVRPGVPHLPPELAPFAPGLAIMVLLSAVLILPLIGAGRSPHVLYRASEIDVGLEDVKGNDVVVEEVVKTLNLFLAHKTFREQMGGTARRAILFEGPPGTGKTYLAKAMAREAGVPYLFVSSSAFQSMYYGQTNRKIRSYFKALRKFAREEGGAIGFIEEIDAIGAARSGMGGGGGREGVSGVVNELLIQLQSFDTPTGSDRVKGWFVDQVNRWLPANQQLRKPAGEPANILVIGATNRAADLDPALLRPGRFDRSIYFDLPNRRGRREIVDYYLAKKAHEPELDDPDRRETLAAMTFGYSPVMLEHLLDEALVWALRRGGNRLGWNDIQQARMTEELGLKQPVDYPEDERRTIATHEAGHATVAHLVGKSRKLEVLSIIKRGQALGLLAHSNLEERFTNTKSEIEAGILIAFGGMVAEELFFGESGTGPAGDLQNATTAAAHMVGSFGMAGTLVSYDLMGGMPGGSVVAKVLASDEGHQAVSAILDRSKAEVTHLLGENRHLVEALRDALLERDELIGSEILDVIRAAELRALGMIVDVREATVITD
ncbi:MAG: cell division protease FtsH [Actinomycetota bacterium]|jgi:ATP-dependent Zn protease|nr:cell division protease FtsH [Actinomycetota bacterium]